MKMKRNTANLEENIKWVNNIPLYFNREEMQEIINVMKKRKKSCRNMFLKEMIFKGMKVKT